MSGEMFTGLFTESGFQPDSPAAWRNAKRSWWGKRCQVRIEKERKDKTPPQLGYFFACVVAEWSAFTGYEKDEMYEELWRSFMDPVMVVSKITGEESLEKPRISACTIDQMSTFISRCIKEGNLLGIRFPDANTWRP